MDRLLEFIVEVEAVDHSGHVSQLLLLAYLSRLHFSIFGWLAFA